MDVFQSLVVAVEIHLLGVCRVGEVCQPVACGHPQASFAVDEAMVDGIGPQSVGFIYGALQCVVAVKFHQAFAECAQPEVSVVVAGDAGKHAVRQLAVDVVAGFQTSVPADVGSVVGRHPHDAVPVLIEAMHIEVFLRGLDACDALRRGVALQDTVFIQSQPELSFAVCVDGAHVGMRAGMSCQADDAFRLLPVVDHQLVFSAGPQACVVVEGYAPHLPVAQDFALIDAGGEYLKCGRFITQEVHALAVISNPDVAERVLEETTGVGGGDAFSLSGADVVETYVFRGDWSFRVKHAHAAHLRTNPDSPVC